MHASPAYRKLMTTYAQNEAGPRMNLREGMGEAWLQAGDRLVWRRTSASGQGTDGCGADCLLGRIRRSGCRFASITAPPYDLMIMTEGLEPCCCLIKNRVNSVMLTEGLEPCYCLIMNRINSVNTTVFWVYLNSRIISCQAAILQHVCE